MAQSSRVLVGIIGGAFAALAQPFENVWQRHVNDWCAWHEQISLPQTLPEPVRQQVSTSAMVLRVHQDKTYHGALVASLSIPWGNGRDDLGGYHLVWPRDLAEAAAGLLALGAILAIAFRAYLRPDMILEFTNWVLCL